MQKINCGECRLRDPPDDVRYSYHLWHREVDQGPNKVDNYLQGQRPLINDVSFSEQSRISYMH